MSPIIQVNDCNSADFKSAMQIYTQAFPSYERHSIESIGHRIQNQSSQLYVYRREDEVIAFALLVNLKNDFVLIDYLAIRVGERGQGIGSQFLDFILNTYTQQSLVLEVENPFFGTENQAKRKRIEFYLRKGFLILDKVNYFLPPLDEFSPPTPMYIMLNTKQKINFSAIKLMLYEIYQSLYNRDSNDVLLNTFIHTISETNLGLISNINSQ